MRAASCCFMWQSFFNGFPMLMVDLQVYPNQADLTVECNQCNLLGWIISEESRELAVNSCLDTL